MKFTILHTEASLGWGGQEIRIFRESLGMRARGHKVIISANPESELLRRAEREGFITAAVEFKRRSFPGLISFFRKLIEKENIHIVNTHSSKDSWLVLPAARLAGNKPLAVRTRHLSTPVGKNVMSRFLYNTLPGFIITTGEAIRTQMIEENKFNPLKIISIPTGVDTDLFNPDGNYNDLRKELGLALSTPLIGSISVIRSWKGLDYFAEAVPLILKEIPDARFIIAGDGPHRSTLEKTIAGTGAGDRIHLLGHREDVAGIIHSLDVIVHPSYANEGVPQTVLQALSMKKPVIAAEIPPLKEIVIENETGKLVPVKDPDSIAKTVVMLLRDKEMSKRLGENGRKLVTDSYSFKAMIDKTECLYEIFSNNP